MSLKDIQTTAATEEKKLSAFTEADATKVFDGSEKCYSEELRTAISTVRATENEDLKEAMHEVVTSLHSPGFVKNAHNGGFDLRNAVGTHVSTALNTGDLGGLDRLTDRKQLSENCNITPEILQQVKTLRAEVKAHSQEQGLSVTSSYDKNTQSLNFATYGQQSPQS